MTDSLTAPVPVPSFTADLPGSAHLAGRQRHLAGPHATLVAGGAGAVPTAQGLQR
ncbi:hypothetical protein [Xanthomonas arboricola]|uniref:hypothetical protein n=1 Tax=Xanthomonas arboricola TaxID=56448 RepID=UPI00137B35B8|nr:hypothetical protein [Xanthomonas arboricola]